MRNSNLNLKQPTSTVTKLCRENSAGMTTPETFEFINFCKKIFGPYSSKSNFKTKKLITGVAKRLLIAETAVLQSMLKIDN